MGSLLAGAGWARASALTHGFVSTDLRQGRFDFGAVRLEVRRQREFREDLNQRRNEELAAVVERANRVIRQIAEAEKFDIIFQEAVYASSRIDITDKVIRSLNAPTR